MSATINEIRDESMLDAVGTVMWSSFRPVCSECGRLGHKFGYRTPTDAQRIGDHHLKVRHETGEVTT